MIVRVLFSVLDAALRFRGDSAAGAGRSTADAIARANGSNTVVELDVAAELTSPLPVGAPPDSVQASLVRPTTGPGGEHGYLVTTPFVVTPSVLGLYRIPAADIAAVSDIVSSRPDLTVIEIGGGFTGDFRTVRVQVSALLPNDTSAPNAGMSG